jgi:hypothetical protein
MKSVESMGEQVIDENLALWDALKRNGGMRWKFNDIIADAMEDFEKGMTTR